jgi:DNA-binding beta-propeller fold protein YncE
MHKIASLLIASSLVPFAVAQRSITPTTTFVRTGPVRLSTLAMIDLPGRPGFGDIAIANNLVVVSQTNANAIDIFDPQKRRLVAQVTNIAQPRGLAVDAKNNRVYVATANSNVAVISSEDWQVKDTFNIEGAPDVLALSADGMRLYAGDKANSTITAVDTSLRKTIGKVELSGRPESIAVGDGNAVFVSVQDQATVVSIDPQVKVVNEFKLQASQPAGMVYDSANRRLYVAVRSGVIALSAETGAEVARVPAPRGVQRLSFDAASHMLYGAGGGSVISLNTSTGLANVDELPADVKGHLLVYDANRKLIFLPGGREGRSKMLIVRDLTAGAAQDSVPAEAKLR